MLKCLSAVLHVLDCISVFCVLRFYLLQSIFYSARMCPYWLLNPKLSSPRKWNKPWKRTCKNITLQWREAVAVELDGLGLWGIWRIVELFWGPVLWALRVRYVFPIFGFDLWDELCLHLSSPETRARGCYGFQVRGHTLQADCRVSLVWGLELRLCHDKLLEALDASQMWLYLDYLCTRVCFCLTFSIKVLHALLRIAIVSSVQWLQISRQWVSIFL